MKVDRKAFGSKGAIMTGNSHGAELGRKRKRRKIHSPNQYGNECLHHSCYSLLWLEGIAPGET